MNMGKPPAFDPVSEVEYLVYADLKDAEADDTLRFVASTSIRPANASFPARAREERAFSTSRHC